MSKAIDDRIGVVTLIELLKHAPANVDVCAAFTVQEEIGLRGAKVAAQYFNPDMAIAIDSTPAHDLPMHDGGENISYNTRLGFGPAIYIADGSTLHDPRLVRFLQATAEAVSIPSAWRRRYGFGCDPKSIGGYSNGIGLGATSLYSFTHQHLTCGGLEEHARFVACRIEENYTSTPCDSLVATCFRVYLFTLDLIDNS
jgi:endoglucanase